MSECPHAPETHLLLSDEAGDRTKEFADHVAGCDECLREFKDAGRIDDLAAAMRDADRETAIALVSALMGVGADRVRDEARRPGMTAAKRVDRVMAALAAVRSGSAAEIATLADELRKADDRHSADGSMLAAATRVLEGRDREIATLKARVESLSTCSTCGGDWKGHASGKVCICATSLPRGNGTRAGEVDALRSALIAAFARVEEAEREREQLRAGYNRVVDSLESRAQRAEALLKYVDRFVLSRRLSICIGSPGSYWFVQDRDNGTPLTGSFPDLDSALRALKAAGLLPDDVKVSE